VKCLPVRSERYFCHPRVTGFMPRANYTDPSLRRSVEAGGGSTITLVSLLQSQRRCLSVMSFLQSRSSLVLIAVSFFDELVISSSLLYSSCCFALGGSVFCSLAWPASNDLLESVVEFLHWDHSVVVMVEALHEGWLLLVGESNLEPISHEMNDHR